MLDIAPTPYAAAPQLTARLGSRRPPALQVHAIALRCQVRIEPQRRGYEQRRRGTGCARCSATGTAGRETLRPFQWMQCHTTVQGFTGSTEVDLALPCTYDFDVIGSRFLHARRRRHRAARP